VVAADLSEPDAPQAVFEPMLARNSGQILNVASIASFMPVPNLAVYAASKAYVLAFSEALSEEIKGSKVTVTALCPGVTDTAMVHGTDLGGSLLTWHP
jgi:short-subunit dehydrogenase